MKLNSQVYLNAAHRIATGSVIYSCHAINFCEQGVPYNEVQKYKEFILGNNPFPWHYYGNTPTTQEERILALCFMWAAVEAGEFE